jgi:hypothetical protein
MEAMMAKSGKKRKLSGTSNAGTPGKVSKSLLMLCIQNLIISPLLASTRPGGNYELKTALNPQQQ